VEMRIGTQMVRDVMTVAPRTVDPRMDLRMLKALFDSYDFNAFPVVDTNGHLLGIVTKLDVLKVVCPDRRRLIPDMKALWAERVEDIMSCGLMAVEPDDTVREAADLMVQSGLRSLPVIEHHGRTRRLVGIVSRTDLLKCLRLEVHASA
jgi:CBS domain-containing protein